MTPFTGRGAIPPIAPCDRAKHLVASSGGRSGREASISVYGTTHGPGPGNYPGEGLSGADNAGAPFGDDFHVYGTQWGPNEIDFYVDSNLYWKVVPSMLPAGAPWVFDHPFFILLNFAVGGNWPGSPDGTSSWPQQMLVDYVRVYSAE